MKALVFCEDQDEGFVCFRMNANFIFIPMRSLFQLDRKDFDNTTMVQRLNQKIVLKMKKRKLRISSTFCLHLQEQSSIRYSHIPIKRIDMLNRLHFPQTNMLIRASFNTY